MYFCKWFFWCVVKFLKFFEGDGDGEFFVEGDVDEGLFGVFGCGFGIVIGCFWMMSVFCKGFGEYNVVCI